MQLFSERLQTLFKGFVHAGGNSRGGGVLQRGNFNGEWRASRPRSQEGGMAMMKAAFEVVW